MQDYFINNVKIVFKEDNKTKEIIGVDIYKNINLIGLLKIIMRVILPMNIVKNLINEHREFNDIKDEKYRVLRSFARDKLVDVAYEITNLKPKLLQNNKLSEKTKGALGGRYFKKADHLENFRNLFGEKSKYYHILTFKVKSERDIYVNSIFKQISFLMEIIQLFSNNKTVDNDMLHDIISNYVFNKKEFDFFSNIVNSLKTKININDNIFNFELINTSLGILNFQKFTENLIKNFENIEDNIHNNVIFSNINDKEFLSFLIKKRIIFNLSAYITSFFNHLFVLIINNQNIKNFYAMYNYINVGSNDGIVLENIKITTKDNYFFKNLKELKKYINTINKNDRLTNIFHVFVDLVHINPIWEDILNFSYFNLDDSLYLQNENNENKIEQLEKIIKYNNVISTFYIEKNLLNSTIFEEKLQNNKLSFIEIQQIFNYLLKQQKKTDNEIFLVKQHIIYKSIKEILKLNTYHDIHKNNFKIDNLKFNDIKDMISDFMIKTIKYNKSIITLNTRDEKAKQFLINFKNNHIDILQNMIKENKLLLNKKKIQNFFEVVNSEKIILENELPYQIISISKNLIINEFRYKKLISKEKLRILELIQNYAIKYDFFTYEELKDLDIEIKNIYESLNNATPKA